MKDKENFTKAWSTDMGAWFKGERVVFRGQDLFEELRDEPWMALLLLGITGREFTPNQIKLFEAIWVICTSYPDPRLWNNRVAALAGTTRSTAALGIAAATAVSEATIYGRRPDIRAIDFIVRAKACQKSDLFAFLKSELKQHRNLAGYGRPVINGDERISPLSAKVHDLGFSEGPYFKLAFEIEKLLLANRYRMQMNVAAPLAALAADAGFSTREYYNYMTLAFSAGMYPCYIDAATQTEGSLFPLSCQQINYQGPAVRNWPKSSEAHE